MQSLVYRSRYWKLALHAPYIWLLRDRNEWNGKGWGACSKDGNSLFVADAVASALPSELLQSLILHEFCHMPFIAEGEENHVSDTGKGQSRRCEKLVWDLTQQWGVDTAEAEIWMRQHFIDNEAELRLRETPLRRDDVEPEFQAARERFIEQLGSVTLPEEFLRFGSDRS